VRKFVLENFVNLHLAVFLDVRLLCFLIHPSIHLSIPGLHCYGGVVRVVLDVSPTSEEL